MTITISIPASYYKKYRILKTNYDKRNTEGADQEQIDRELKTIIEREISKTISKYGLRKKEKKLEKEILQWSQALEFLMDISTKLPDAEVLPDG